MMCDDCIYSKDSICTFENPIISDSWDCLSKIDKETYAKIYNKALDDFAEKIIDSIDGEFMYQFKYFPAITIRELAEQLKAGRSDE